MTQPSQEINLVGSEPGAIPNLQRFSHQAMATTFEIFIVHPDADYACQAAYAAFGEINRLEAELSRFIENSDVARINNLAAGQPLQVSLPTFECLQIAGRMYDETDGAFDVTIGALSGESGVELDQDGYTVKVVVDSIKVDLGGIGKGYAVDMTAGLLGEWDINVALIHGGYSSVLAVDKPAETNGWPITFSNPADMKQTLAHIELQNRAVGASGLLKGVHIIDPRTAKPVQGNTAAWAVASDAATADALSTAFMVMTPEQVNQYCQGHPDVAAMIIVGGPDTKTQNKRICRYGRWEVTQTDPFR